MESELYLNMVTYPHTCLCIMVTPKKFLGTMGWSIKGKRFNKESLFHARTSLPLQSGALHAGLFLYTAAKLFLENVRLPFPPSLFVLDLLLFSHSYQQECQPNGDSQIDKLHFGTEYHL